MMNKMKGRNLKSVLPYDCIMGRGILQERDIKRMCQVIVGTFLFSFDV